MKYYSINDNGDYGAMNVCQVSFNQFYMTLGRRVFLKYRLHYVTST